MTGPHRTLVQDPVFAIDQLVEIAIRALSAAVNDTFTALTCIDWLAAGLGESRAGCSTRVSTGTAGKVRLIESDPSYARMVNRAFDKIRQAASGMPAVLIRLIDSIGSIMLDTTSTEQRDVLRRQADMVLRLSEATVAEAERPRGDPLPVLADRRRGRVRPSARMAARVDLPGAEGVHGTQRPVSIAGGYPALSVGDVVVVGAGVVVVVVVVAWPVPVVSVVPPSLEAGVVVVRVPSRGQSWWSWPVGRRRARSRRACWPGLADGAADEVGAATSGVPALDRGGGRGPGQRLGQPGRRWWPGATARA